MDLKQYQRMAERIERLRDEAQRQRGAAEELQRQLYGEFEVKTVPAGQKLLKRLRDDLATLEKKAGKALEAFRERWADKLED